MNLKPGERFETPETFVAVHDGDYFAALSSYRLLMSERGMTPADAGLAVSIGIFVQLAS